MKSNSFTFTGLLLLASASAGPSEADLIAEYDPFATAAAVNASLNECYTNHATVYANKAAPPPSCPFYFERDFTTMYWCRDKSCAISDAIQTHTGNTYPESCDDPDPDFVAPPNDSNFFIDSNFVTRNKDPAAIPCGTQLHDQASYGTRCVRGEDWASSKKNYDINNYWNVDFETPSYQSNSCCSSVARFGFAGKYAGISNNGGERNIHDPFARTKIDVRCDVMRKSKSGNTCGKGDTWDDFGGTGVCGIHTSSGSVDSATAAKIDAWATANSATITSHPDYCSDANLDAACDVWTSSDVYARGNAMSAWNNQACDSPTFDMGAMTCPPVTTAEGYRDLVRGPPLDSEEKGVCRSCLAVTKAFSGFPCSGRQGEFVDEAAKVFRVCKSACDVLFDTCGLPTHRGGMYATSTFNPTSEVFEGDYSDAVSMCQAMWEPHAQSVWAIDGYTLSVVDDAVEGHEKCVALERLVADFNYDTQNFIFDYGAIRNKEGFCSLEDPLFDNAAPCSDLEVELEVVVEAERRRQLGGTYSRAPKKDLGSKKQGGKSMYALGDMSRAEMIATGWPWEDNNNSRLIIAAIVGAAVVGVLAIIGGVMYARRKNSRNINTTKEIEAI
ncbi:hypothetical protein TrST_g13970 [Triparma strigata]|uniref:Uncharacterized protein n=1 Tax=Triparma strigata TaxID=1606541 RepID=A0A9W7ERS4_9STRA|nr:hypothetical protein TrST_g13970 [Triparma strigata]